MTLSSGDKNVVSNIRNGYKEKVELYSDELIAKCWRKFSQLDEYPDKEKFLDWLSVEYWNNN